MKIVFLILRLMIPKVSDEIDNKLKLCKNETINTIHIESNLLEVKQEVVLKPNEKLFSIKLNSELKLMKIIQFF